jgi:hypothetical protein
MAGRCTAPTPRAARSRRRRPGWPRRARPGQHDWVVHADEESAVGVALQNNFGLTIGHLALRYSDERVRQAAQAVARDLALNSLAVFVVAATLASLALLAVMRRLGRDMHTVEAALRADDPGRRPRRRPPRPLPRGAAALRRDRARVPSRTDRSAGAAAARGRHMKNHYLRSVYLRLAGVVMLAVVLALAANAFLSHRSFERALAPEMAKKVAIVGGVDPRAAAEGGGQRHRLRRSCTAWTSVRRDRRRDPRDHLLQHHRPPGRGAVPAAGRARPITASYLRRRGAGGAGQNPDRPRQSVRVGEHYLVSLPVVGPAGRWACCTWAWTCASSTT